MAERKDALPSASDDDASLDEAAPRERRLPTWLIPVLAILVPAIAGGVIAFSQYETLAIGSAEARLWFASANDTGDRPRAYGEFVKIEGMIVNPAGSEGKRFLMVDLGLESTSSAVLGELQQKEIVVRDTILKVLGSRTVEELASLEHRNAMKTDLIGAVNSVLSRGAVDYLYFTQYVLQ